MKVWRQIVIAVTVPLTNIATRREKIKEGTHHQPMFRSWNWRTKKRGYDPLSGRETGPEEQPGSSNVYVKNKAKLKLDNWNLLERAKWRKTVIRGTYWFYKLVECWISPIRNKLFSTYLNLTVLLRHSEER